MVGTLGAAAVFATRKTLRKTGMIGHMELPDIPQGRMETQRTKAVTAPTQNDRVLMSPASRVVPHTRTGKANQGAYFVL